MNQRVTSSRFPYLTIEVQFYRRSDVLLEVEALVDTGFDGSLTLPPSLLPAGIEPSGESDWGLANGGFIRAPWFRAFVNVKGIHPPLLTRVVVMGDEVLVGRDVTNSFRVTFDHGRQVIVEP